MPNAAPFPSPSIRPRSNESARRVDGPRNAEPSDDAAANGWAAGEPRGRTGILGQLAKYCGVSATQTFVELGVFLAFEALGMPAKAANACAIVCSGSYNFAMNRAVTFKASSNFARSVAMFIALYCWNLLFCNAMLDLLPGLLGWSAAGVKIFTMCCQGAWGFLLCRYVIFK